MAVKTERERERGDLYETHAVSETIADLRNKLHQQLLMGVAVLPRVDKNNFA